MALGELGERISEVTTRLRSDLVRGVRNPNQVPPYVLGLLFPASRWGPNWRAENGVITFEDGGFAGGSPGRPELSARIYREVRQLEALVGDRHYDRSLEVGCGYGRLTGWISEYASETVGVDPDGEALETAGTLYPDVRFVETVAQSLPFAPGSFDLVVSWSVLQHVSPDAIDDVVAELRRVCTDDATLVLCELTAGEPGRASWPRSRAEYDALFGPFDLVDSVNRPAERTFSYAQYADTMVFRNEGGHSTDEAVGEARSDG